jgi:transcription elongation factor Elf1
MTPFSKYVNCLNCGNELTHLSKLAFNAPSMIECDFCGQSTRAFPKGSKD